MVQKKKLDEDMTRDEIPRDLAPGEIESEIPEVIEATGSTSEIAGQPIVEAEVGGEGTVDVVAEHTRDEETSSSIERDETEDQDTEGDREAA